MKTPLKWRIPQDTYITPPRHPKTHINQTNKDQTQRANIKSSKGKATNNTRLTVDLSIETLQARREWQDILKVMKEKNLQPRFLYPASISLRFKGEIKSFTDKQKLREFSTTNQLFNKCKKDLL